MQLLTRTPTLTGVATGGTMVRPAPALLSLFNQPANLRTLWICKITLSPPIEGDIPLLVPTLHTQLRVSPGTG